MKVPQSFPEARFKWILQSSFILSSSYEIIPVLFAESVSLLCEQEIQIGVEEELQEKTCGCELSTASLCAENK